MGHTHLLAAPEAAPPDRRVPQLARPLAVARPLPAAARHAVGAVVVVAPEDGVGLALAALDVDAAHGELLAARRAHPPRRGAADAQARLHLRHEGRVGVEVLLHISQALDQLVVVFDKLRGHALAPEALWLLRVVSGLREASDELLALGVLRLQKRRTAWRIHDHGRREQHQRARRPNGSKRLPVV